jgi:hypothetical protein
MAGFAGAAPRCTQIAYACSIALGLTAGLPATGLADATRFGVDTEFSHSTNVNRAVLDAEKQDDNALAVEGYAARSFLLGTRSGVVARGGLRAREYFDFGDLSSLTLSGRAAYRVQPTPGFRSPIFELAVGAEAFKHWDSDIRDGYLAFATASVASHITDRIRLEGGLGYEQRDASEGEVYDLGNAKAWAALDYKLTPAATLYGSATWLDGEQVFTLNNRAAWGNLYAGAAASAPDPVFASAFGGSTPWAYRVDASTTVFELGLNFAFTGSQALDLGVSRFEAKADGGDGRYDGITFRAGYLYRFR